MAKGKYFAMGLWLFGGIALNAVGYLTSDLLLVIMGCTSWLTSGIVMLGKSIRGTI